MCVCVRARASPVNPTGNSFCFLRACKREDGAREPSSGGPKEAGGTKHWARAGEMAKNQAGSRHRSRQPGSFSSSEFKEHFSIGAER